VGGVVGFSGGALADADCDGHQAQETAGISRWGALKVRSDQLRRSIKHGEKEAEKVVGSRATGGAATHRRRFRQYSLAESTERPLAGAAVA
jgi:hypothetical protein